MVEGLVMELIQLNLGAGGTQKQRGPIHAEGDGTSAAVEIVSVLWRERERKKSVRTGRTHPLRGWLERSVKKDLGF